MFSNIILGVICTTLFFPPIFPPVSEGGSWHFWSEKRAKERLSPEEALRYQCQHDRKLEISCDFWDKDDIGSTRDARAKG